MRAVATEPEASAVAGVVVPGGSVRERYFRVSLLFFVVALIWSVVSTVIMIGQGLGLVLALVGQTGLIERFIPVSATVFGTFWVVSVIAGTLVAYV